MGALELEEEGAGAMEEQQQVATSGGEVADDVDPLAELLGEDARRGRKKNKSWADAEQYQLSAEKSEQKVQLLCACRDNDTERAMALLRAGAPATGIDAKTGWTSLDWSIFNDNLQLVKGLLRATTAHRQEEQSMGEVPPECSSRGSNTALHWAAMVGNPRIVWALLKHGYHHGDCDAVGNTPAHLAAAHGHAAALSILLEDGANPGARNRYKNSPLDMATDAACVRVLEECQLPQEGSEAHDSAHERNLRRLERAEEELREAIRSSEASESKEELSEREEMKGGEPELEHDPELEPAEQLAEEPEQEMEEPIDEEQKETDQLERTGSEEGDKPESVDGTCDGKKKELAAVPLCTTLMCHIDRIQAAVDRACALCADEEIIECGLARIDVLLLQERIEQQMARITDAEPIITQRAFTSLVNVLIQLTARARSADCVPLHVLQRAQALIDKSHAEYWLQMATLRLVGVDRASQKDSWNMAKLGEAIHRALSVGANEELIAASSALLRPLTIGVEIQKASESIPAVRLPPILEEGQKFPKEWWRVEDIGHIEESEHFPLPSTDADGHEHYPWISSSSLTKLRASVLRLAAALGDASTTNVNEDVVKEGKAAKDRADRDLAILEQKDAEDRDKAVAAAVKSAKKFKKAKGKRGKSKAAAG